MKYIISIIVMVVFLEGKGYHFSNLPVPATELLDIEPGECDAACQESYIRQGHFLSLGARAHEVSDEALYYKNLFSPNLHADKPKIAILLPTKVIGRYSIFVTNAVTAYMLASGQTFDIKTFDSGDESEESLQETLKQIIREGFSYCIAPMTQEGAERLVHLNTSLNLYIPTIHRDSIEGDHYLVTFGGIDYKKQIDRLKSFIKSELFVFDEAGAVSQGITEYAIKDDDLPITQLTIKNQIVKYNNIFDAIPMDENSSVLLNTQPVKTSLLLSQFTYHDLNLSSVLSTQINFNPMLLTLTQASDITKLYIANSITSKNAKIEEYNSMLHNDIVFNWINYSTSILTNVISNAIHGNHSGYSKVFRRKIDDRQIDYDVDIYRAESKRFYNYTP